MANDRLFAQCRACGAEWAMAKFYPSTSWTPTLDYNRPGNETRTFHDWMLEHTDMGHYTDHDAWQRAFDQPFAFYQEKEQPIPRYVKPPGLSCQEGQP
jgi:hypothetical protein